MTAVSTVEARNHFSEIVNRVAFAKERQILSRRGKAIVAFVPIEDLERLEELENRADLIEAKEELRHVKKHVLKSWASIKKELEL